LFSTIDFTDAASDYELVDLALVEKRRNDASATHHPDVFPLLLPQTSCERFDWFHLRTPRPQALAIAGD
jgi:hypothetical protein